MNYICVIYVQNPHRGRPKKPVETAQDLDSGIRSTSPSEFISSAVETEESEVSMEEPVQAKGRGRVRERGRARGRGKIESAKGRGRKKGGDDKGGEVDLATRAKKAQDDFANAYIDILENKNPEKIAIAWATINGKM